MSDQIKIALAALSHPQGLAILDSLYRLTGQNSQFSTDKVANNGIAEFESDLPRSLELQYRGVDLKNGQLLQVANQYQLQVPSAVEAWLEWASYTNIEYPTLSLIRAIEENWKPRGKETKG